MLGILTVIDHYFPYFKLGALDDISKELEAPYESELVVYRVVLIIASKRCMVQQYSLSLIYLAVTNSV